MTRLVLPLLLLLLPATLAHPLLTPTTPPPPPTHVTLSSPAQTPHLAVVTFTSSSTAARSFVVHFTATPPQGGFTDTQTISVHSDKEPVVYAFSWDMAPPAVKVLHVSATVAAVGASGEASTAVRAVPEVVQVKAPQETSGEQGGEGDSWPVLMFVLGVVAALVALVAVVLLVRYVRRRCCGDGATNGSRTRATSSSTSSVTGLGKKGQAPKNGVRGDDEESAHILGGAVRDSDDIELPGRSSSDAALVAAATATDDDDDEIVLHLPSLLEPTHDPVWFQQVWQAVDDTEFLDGKLSAQITVDAGFLESCVERHDFRIVASGEPSSGVFKIYCTAQPDNSPIAVLCEAVADVHQLSLSASLKCMATTRREQRRLIHLASNKLQRAFAGLVTFS